MFITDDGSAVRHDGTVIIFSIERVRDIGEGGSCFICGRSRDEVPFNDEHIIPDWVLRRTGFARRLQFRTTPEQSELGYRHPGFTE
jgi:hypothetical protein